MTTLRDYLERRRRDAEQQLEPLQTTASELRSKLRSIDGQLMSLTKEISDIDKALQALGKSEATSPPITIKDAILQVLADAPQGLSSRQLLEALNARYFEGKLERTSMSPQLSRLRNVDKKIHVDGDRYFLT